jgi:hypothetical protein
MKKIIKMAFKPLTAVLIITGIFLASCSTLTFPTTVCHATGDPANAYTGITVNSADELLEHRSHTNDVFPMPAGGCPTTLVENDNGKITICHATGSDKNPYTEITVSVYGLNGHARHEGDIIPMPAGGCPTTGVDAKTNKGLEKKSE